MPRKEIYNQKNNKVVFNGISIQGYANGSSIEVEHVGGEVDITEGTDGGGLNIATDQGIKIRVTLRETSPSIDIIETARTVQNQLSTPNVVLLQTGADIKYTVTNALVSKPGNLSTGDKTQGSVQYEFVGTQIVTV